MWRVVRLAPFPSSLQTPRLTLRLPDDEGARVEHEMILESLDHLWPWFAFRAKPPTLAERVALATRQRAEAMEGTAASYVVFAGDQAVGKVWIDVKGTTAEMGWWLRASATGHGYATEAGRAAVDVARRIGAQSVWSFTSVGNERSQAVMRRLGLSFVRYFDHPNIPTQSTRRHVLYQLDLAGPEPRSEHQWSCQMIVVSRRAGCLDP